MEVISGAISVSFLGSAKAFKVALGVPGSTIMEGITNAVGLEREGATLATGVSLVLKACSACLGFCKFDNSSFDTHFHHFLEFSKSNLT